MKKYIKDEQIKFRNQIVLHGTRTIKGKDGKEKEVKTQVINPSEAQLLADGWVEYVIPEPTEAELLDIARRNLRGQIERYDSSSEINVFYVSGIAIWLDKATRAGLLLRFQAEQAQGIEDTTLWYKGMQFPLKVEQAIQMLYAIELYASACYDNTQRHFAALDMLEDEESVKAYDYTTGYPERLRF